MFIYSGPHDILIAASCLRVTKPNSLKHLLNDTSVSLSLFFLKTFKICSYSLYLASLYLKHFFPDALSIRALWLICANQYLKEHRKRIQVLNRKINYA